MGWFDKKDDTKGKSEVPPPDKKDEQQSKSEADVLIEKLGLSIETKMQAALKPLSDTVTTLKSKWDALEDAAKKPPVKQDDKSDTPPARVTLEEASIDPAKEQEWLAQNILPGRIEAAKLNARLTERECLDSLSSEFDFLKPDIRKIFDEQTPIGTKARADYSAYCNNVVKMVVGDAALKAGLRAQGQGDKRRFYLEDGSSKGKESDGTSLSEVGWTDSKGRVHTGEDTLKKLQIEPAEFVKGSEVTH